ncbi:hypothetical protein GLOIN_2v1645959 [Rhizophagus clarus]|uniref:Uncharacterized protein n=1 Tax=Rhizophagus clarus TaxID=94130 RepID=A0A8H3MBM7_9GLOM|nr:hypothetical protein GLOIN_2v1645959 [Rhizophagus clarus]
MFYLQLGWALKRNQKYGKMGSGKRLTKKVVAALTHFFMVGQRDPSDRYTAKDMLDGLKEMAENGEITTEKNSHRKVLLIEACGYEDVFTKRYFSNDEVKAFGKTQ